MKTNSKLKIVIAFIKVSRVLLFVFMLSLLFIAVHSNFYPEYYNKLIVNYSANDINFDFKSDYPDIPKTQEEWEALDVKYYYWNLLGTSTKIRVISQFLVELGFAIVFISYLIQFLKSFDYPTFFTRGIMYLKKIRYWIIGMIAVSCFFMLIGITFYICIPDNPLKYYPSSYQYVIHCYSFTIPFKPIFFLVICWIIELVFKEGERLREENELTV